MVELKLSFNAARLSIILVVVLLIVWNLLEFVISPYILDIPLHIVKYLIYTLAGYTAAKRYKMDMVGGTFSGGITAGIGALVEGLLIAPIFHGHLFYYWGPGMPITSVLSSIIIPIIIGSICGAAGSAASTVNELNFIADTLKLE